MCGVVCCGGGGGVWHAENLVCRFKTLPCVGSKRAHVQNMRALSSLVDVPYFVFQNRVQPQAVEQFDDTQEPFFAGFFPGRVSTAC